MSGEVAKVNLPRAEAWFFRHVHRTRQVFVRQHDHHFLRHTSKLAYMPKRKAPPYPEGINKNDVAKASPSKRRKNVDEELIDKANSMTTDEFEMQYIDSEGLEYSTRDTAFARGFKINFVSSANLTKDELNACFKLVESTSRPDYDSSSWGWHPKRKKREMKEDEMRYLLVRSARGEEHRDGGPIDRVEGFFSFMLTHDSTPSVPVLYIYEIHLEQSLRKVGLGTHLMDMAERTAERVGVAKVMLTCFLSNEKAHGYYKRRGYVTDVCSPEDRKTRNKVVKADYVIMSKDIEGPQSNAEPATRGNVRGSHNIVQGGKSQSEADNQRADCAGQRSFVKDSDDRTKSGASKSYNAFPYAPGRVQQSSSYGKLDTVNKENRLAEVG